MKRFTIGLPKEDYQQLESKAEQKRIPVAVMARTILVEGLEKGDSN